MKNEGILSNCLIRFNLRSKALLITAPRPIFTLILLAFTALINTPVRAQEPSAVHAGQGQVSLFADHGLEGVWDVVVTIRDAAGNPVRSFRAMNMYIHGGQFEEFGVGTPPGQRGLGMGLWQSDGKGRYSAVLEFFRFNADGTFAGTQKVKRTLELNSKEDSFSSIAEIQILDINGQLIQSGFATETAIRFK
jgi:hypothetical protein